MSTTTFLMSTPATTKSRLLLRIRRRASSLVCLELLHIDACPLGHAMRLQRNAACSTFFRHGETIS